MSRLARPVAQAKPTYDVIVVGSGYGGGVAASRLARIGLSVAVLERGREYLPGEFAENMLAASTSMQINTGGRRIGPADALFDLRVGKDIHALVGCGLGGTSLINAAVCLIPDTTVLDDEAWPEEIRIDHRLNVGYHRAREMLAPEPLPETSKPIKLASIERAAAALGHRAVRAPLHIAFENRTNAAGVAQPACSQCGDCMGGCNTGSKTTVHSTYLTDAVNHGAELFTGANVRLIERVGGDLWRVVFRRNDADGSHVPVGAITAAMVVLAAGTLGTAEIMIRSREQGLRVSDRLGWRFSTNADVMSFGYNYDRPVNSVGIGHSGHPKVPPPGPAVVGLIDLRRRRDPLDRVALVEATVPSAMAGLMPMLLASGAKLAPAAASGGIAGLLANARRDIESVVAGAYKGPVHHSHAFLAVGHDGAAGRLVFEHDSVAVHWPRASDEPVYTHISAMLRTGVAANNGTYVPNPVSSELLGGDLMTVHPLGGCSMGRDRTTGVVDHKCRVYDGDPAKRADAVHDGLYICDGSVIPRPLGVHPLFTITAVAERAMILFAREHGLPLDVAPQRDAPKREFRADPKAAGAGRTAPLFGRLLDRGAKA